MEINFNKKRLIELIQYSQKLRSEGKFIFNEDKEADSELLSYLTIISDCVYWRNRKKFLKPMERFLANEINADQFIDEFFEVLRSNRDLVRDYETQSKKTLTLQNFEIIPEASHFSSLPNRLVSFIDLFVGGDDEESKKYRKEYCGIDETELQSIVKDFFNVMKQYD